MLFSVIRGDLSIICSGKTLCEIFCRFWLWAYTTGHCVDITWLCLPGVHNTSLWTARVPYKASIQTYNNARLGCELNNNHVSLRA